MKKGIFFALLTALISGFSVFANSFFVTQSDPLAFVAMRNALVCLFFAPLVLFALKSTKIKPKDIPALIAIGLVGGGIPFALFFKGLSLTSAVSANIINKSLFLWIGLLAPLLLRERLTWRMILGYGIMFYSIIYLSKGEISVNLGNILVLSATIFWAFEYILIKKALKYFSASLVAFSRMLFGLPVLFMSLKLFGDTSDVSAIFYAQGPALLVSSLFLAIYMLSLFEALKYAKVTLVSSILVLSPFVTALLSYFVKGRILPEIFIPQLFISLLGLAFFITGVVKKPRLEKAVDKFI